MPRISRVSWPEFQVDYGWMFDIQTDDELLDWTDRVRRSAIQKEFHDAVNSHEAGGPGGHARDGSYLVAMAGIKGISIVDALSKLAMDHEIGMNMVLHTAGRIFINSRGGYFAYSNSLSIEDTRTIDVYAFPVDIVRVISWPGGKHFYAKVGNDDVVVNGNQKWDTYKLAESAGREYLKNKRR